MAEPITHTIPGFIGGISQQSPAIRLETQAELMENFQCTVANGLQQRPNTELIKVLGAITVPTGMHVHFINRDSSEQYVVILTSDSTSPIRVFDLDGTEQTVRYGTLDEDLNYTSDDTVKNYLSSGGITSARSQIKAVTVADHTIVLNTQKTAAMNSTATGGKEQSAYVWVQSRHAGDHEITLMWYEGVTLMSSAYYTTSSSTQTDTAALAQWFHSNAPTAITDKFDVTHDGSVVRFLKNDPAVNDGSITVKISDPWGGGDLIPISQAEVSGIEDLPPTGVSDDFVCKVSGDFKEGTDDYYMQFDSDTRTWTECPGHGVNTQFDEATLPHRLVRTAVSEFTFAPIIWEDRAIGDDETNPAPTFIGDAINNLTFHKGRLWLMSGENIISSRANGYFNFWRHTALDIVDDDPIDAAASSTTVNNTKAAVAFEKGLILFSDQSQFIITSGEDILSPKTASVDPTTSYSAESTCEPVKVGPDIYFLCPRSKHMSVREYTIVPDSMKQDAYNVTSHIPQYLPRGDESLLAGSNSTDQLFMWSNNEADAVYVHQFLWSGQEKVQQAWYKWTYADDIYGFFIFGTVLYLVTYDSTNGYRLEKSELESLPYDDEPFRYHVDCIMELSAGSYSNPDTAFTLPMNVGDGDGWTVIDSENQLELATDFTLSSNTLTIQNQDASSKTYFVGRSYECRFRFSEFFMKDAQGHSIINGVLTVKGITLSYKDTGYFEVEITHQKYDQNPTVQAEVFTGVEVGQSIIGQATLLNGAKSFTVAGDSRDTQIDIVTDSYLPVQLQLAAWEATFNQRSKSV